MTLPDCLEVAKIDVDDEEVVEGEAVEETVDEDKKEKVIYYVTDPITQSQYVKMFKDAKMDAVVLTHNIDQPFISQLEQKNENIKFQRIDADLTDTFKKKTSKKDLKQLEEESEALAGVFKKALNKENFKVKVENLKNKKISSIITLSEEGRRMQDMMKMYSMPGMDMGMFGGESETLTLNANNDLVKFVIDNKENEKTSMVCEHLYDMAKIQHAQLSADEMSRFIDRSNEILLLFMK